MSLKLTPIPALDPAGYDLFISYASRDEVTEIGGQRIGVVREFKTMLEAHRHPQTGRRFRVCTYREDFDLSGDLAEVISARLRAASHLIVLCSPRATSSKWVQQELREFKAVHGRNILAARFDLDPAEAFPDYFTVEGLATNLSFTPVMSASDWLAQAVMESHKLVAKVWQIELRAVHDRFEEERRRSEQLDLEARAALAELLTQEEDRGVDALINAVESAGRSILKELDPPTRAFGALASSIRAARTIQIVGHAGPIEVAEFSPDGAYVLTGGADHTARIWSSRDGHLVKTLGPHSSAIKSLDISPDGTRAVTGGSDGVAVLWSFPDGQFLQTLNH
ncbi:MAG: TIR domain-containing protein, partial [Verrucomicrobiales bacterium]|nr:TIR domain-containing protein [Verrucomicrobiales bacterium]